METRSRCARTSARAKRGLPFTPLSGQSNFCVVPALVADLRLVTVSFFSAPPNSSGRSPAAGLGVDKAVAEPLRTSPRSFRSSTSR